MGGLTLVKVNISGYAWGRVSIDQYIATLKEQAQIADECDTPDLNSTTGKDRLCLNLKKMLYNKNCTGVKMMNNE